MNVNTGIRTEEISSNNNEIDISFTNLDLTDIDSEAKIVKINFSVILNSLFVIALSSIFFGYFLNFYLEVDESIKYTYSSILLLIILINCGKELFKNITVFIICIKNYNKKFLKKRFEEMVHFNSKIVRIIYLLSEAVAIAAMILCVPIFIPYTEDNCHEYSYGLCVYGRIAAFFGIIYVILYGIIACFLILALLIFGASVYQEKKKTVLRMSSLPVVGNLVSIINLYEEECSICLTDGKEGDSEFIKLSCDHKFHKKCIINWIRTPGVEQVCPLCRKPIETTVLSNQV